MYVDFNQQRDMKLVDTNFCKRERSLVTIELQQESPKEATRHEERALVETSPRDLGLQKNSKRAKP